MNKSAHKRHSFVPVSADELTGAFMRRMAVRNGIIASTLLLCPKAPKPKTKI